MAGQEYVRVSAGENTYGQTNLLQVQLELLDSMKSLKNYRKLRQESGVLKVKLKEKISEVQDLLDKLLKGLPKTEYKIAGENLMPKKIRKKPEDLSIEEEIDSIQRKLRQLRG